MLVPTVTHKKYVPIVSLAEAIDASVATAPPERMIDTRQLNARQKQQLWQGIKTLEPPLADLLKNDVNIQAFKTEFDATLQFSATDIERFMAGAEPEKGHGQ
jgi:hypothetical protein